MVTKKEPLTWLEDVQKRAKELRAEEAAVKEAIRSGFVDCAILFMDVVGSTAFKQTHAETPEVWILRIRQFSELLAAAVIGAQGRVVKYIGDEVMAVFENIYDAQNLIGRIEEIEKNLAEATGYETRIKVAADFGKVYFLTFPGHQEKDPQGPAVDRCARIAKYGQPGEVLASADFAGKTVKLGWKKVGQIDLKGLGSQVIYQLGHVTIDLAPTVTIKEEEYNKLKEILQESQFKIQELKAKNERLASELVEAGKNPETDDLAADKENDKETLWEIVTSLLKKLAKVIKDSHVPNNQYARFLFLLNIDSPGERYNKWEGKVFDESIEAGLVSKGYDDFYSIDESHPRNRQAIVLMRAVNEALAAYLEHHEQDPDDMYRWSLSDPEFWNNFVGINVTSF